MGFDPSDPAAMKYMGKNLAGTEITIVGLRARPELNGTNGIMLNWHADSERWMVKCPSGESLRLKYENVQFPTGEEYEAEQARQRESEDETNARVAAAVAPSIREAPADSKPPPGWAAGEKARAEWRAKEDARLRKEKAARLAKAEADAAAARAAEVQQAEDAARLKANGPSFLSNPMDWLAHVMALLMAWLRTSLAIPKPKTQ